MHYHLALILLIQSTGEPEITEVTLDNLVMQLSTGCKTKVVFGGKKGLNLG
jgi:hypothetical protein